MATETKIDNLTTEDFEELEDEVLELSAEDLGNLLLGMLAERVVVNASYGTLEKDSDVITHRIMSFVIDEDIVVQSEPEPVDLPFTITPVVPEGVTVQ